MNIDNRDFRPKPNSVLIDAGTVINGITDSYEGAAPDIGAYEYGGVFGQPVQTGAFQQNLKHG